ncbi:hypothetical protein, partial [Serratia marcescens]|uniref:hypothetical protein n=1 Tax=Serratia marcescens TaxID=615 RepID=UPI001C8BB283
GADDSAVKWQYRTSDGGWKNFASTGKFDGNIYTPGSDDVGDVVRACVTPKGKEQSIKGSEACVADADVMTIFAAPTVKGVKAKSTTVEAGKSLGVSYTFVANGTGDDASTYQWMYREETSGDWKAPQSADAKELDWKPDASYAGYQVRLTITPTGKLHPELQGA